MRRRIQVVISTLIILLLAFDRCAYNDINVAFNCDNSTLSISLVSQSDVTNCRAIDGVITVTATDGLQPYNFNINGGEYQTNPTFTNLGPGTYAVRVKDANNCWKEISVTIGAAGSTLAATVETTSDNLCGGDNGTAKVHVTGGSPPYQIQMDSKGYGGTDTFDGLKEGQHVVIVKDAEECQTTLSVHIEHGQTGVSYANQIKTIITNSCAKSGCHDHNTGSRDWTVLSNVQANAGNIKIRTANHTMPPDTPLSQSEIDLIGCWVDDGALDN
jgi:hypothetical protein